MRNIIEALILGIIQGFSEFIPISSSAHLKFFEWFFNFTQSESFDVALHIGTLIALCIFFFKDGINLIKNGIRVCLVKLFKNDKISMNEEEKKNGSMFWYIVLATIPAGILSLVLDKVKDLITGENIQNEIVCIGAASIFMGLLLYFVDKFASTKKTFKDYNLKDVLLIGCSQALAAAFPGVSRSGVSITASRGTGYDRESSARLSFLLSIPMVLAAVVFSIKDFDLTDPIAFIIGIVTSCAVGLLVINYFMKFIKNSDYKIFAIYRFIFGLLMFIALMFK
jgi:undecaprenyl-diphosphatase